MSLNTHALRLTSTASSAAQKAGVGRFRIELVRETPADVGRIVAAYRGLLDGETTASELLRGLRTEGGYGVVRGSLRVLEP